MDNQGSGSGQSNEDLTVDGLDIDGIYLETPDDLIEENFEDAFMSSNFNSVDYSGGDDDAQDDYKDIARHGIVEVAGDDKYSRKVIVIYACRLPSNKTFNHMRFLR
jgi:Rho GTPase-activating protein 1